MKVELVKYPSAEDYIWVKQCAYVTVGKDTDTVPRKEWLHRILKARHSPIRELNFRFLLTDIPYYVSVHLVRHHEGVNWFIQSQRNDRQDKYDRESARQDAPVMLRVGINAEELMTVANKRLCNLASPATREVVRMMCDEVLKVCPEFEGLLVPMCEYGRCHEMYPCGKKAGGSDG